jgi:hypothetical protein
MLGPDIPSELSSIALYLQALVCTQDAGPLATDRGKALAAQPSPHRCVY